MSTTTTHLPSLLTGLIFGGALFLSGVSSPTTLTTQFTLTNQHMLITFLTASLISALIVYISNRTGFARISARSCSEYSFPGLGRYGGNIAGGVMQGIGMAVSGACPGTMLVQCGSGWGRGGWVLAGSVLGGMGFVLVGGKLRRKVGEERGGSEVKTLYEVAGVRAGGMLVLYEVVVGGVIFVTTMFTPVGVPWRQAVVGGGLIGFAQAVSVLVSRKTLGVSTAYQDVAGHVIATLDRKRTRPGWSSVIFAIGVTIGAKIVGEFLEIESPNLGVGAVDIGVVPAVVGGAMFIVGARLAGGCTSGHGISGCATLSVSSVITVVAMFGGGIVFKMLF